jgi:putative nucleotidyltransferase with HDIG domain
MAFKQYHIFNKGPDNRTRLLHTIEVMTNASYLAKRLGLDVELAEAIALGHDIAQPPCGYPADRELDKKLREEFRDKDGFNHGKLGADILFYNSLKRKSDGERRFNFLKKTKCFEEVTNNGVEYISTISPEVLDGIRKHTPPYVKGKQCKFCDSPLTLEGQIVRIADNLSYISQEISEAIRLDKKYITMLKEYAETKQEYKNNKTGEIRNLEDLLKPPHPSLKVKPEFIKDIFSVRLGPRIMTMLKRFEMYNKIIYDDANKRDYHQKWISTEFCEKKIPVFKYDQRLEFINDMYWDSILANVNEDARVINNINANRKKILDVFNLRMEREPTNKFEKENYDARKKEVEYFYPDLSDPKPRIIAHHIATLTDGQINKIVKGVKNGRS